MTHPPEDDPPLPEIDFTRPHPARIYDYGLGGKNHFAADRAMAEQVLSVVPTARTVVRENRRFLGRVVRFLAGEVGIRQFLDIGSGLPATENVHEVAQRAEPSSRVVYVDNDPLVLVHSRALLTSSPEGRASYIKADLRDPKRIISDLMTREVLDFSQPIALMLIAVLPYLRDEDGPEEIIATLLDALAPGSCLAATHITAEHDHEGWAGVARAYRGASITGQFRESDEFARIAFTGLDLVPPGVVLVSDWRPDDQPPRPSAAEVSSYGGVARKP